MPPDDLCQSCTETTSRLVKAEGLSMAAEELLDNLAAINKHEPLDDRIVPFVTRLRAAHEVFNNA